MEDENYEFINKFGRGMWEETQLRKTFNKREMFIIVRKYTLIDSKYNFI